MQPKPTPAPTRIKDEAVLETISMAADETVRAEPSPDGTAVSTELIADRYRLVKKLGQGGMATVYLAKDLENDQQLALKIPNLVAKDEAFLKRFQREARAIAAIKHPNVCGFHEIAEHKGRLFLTMDYIQGQPLSEWIQESPDISVERAIEIVLGVASGVQAAHEAGVVHRDLKTANVIMAKDGRPVIADFGMACWTDLQETVLTPSGAMVGTPGYMAPEQIVGDKERIGPTTDVYSIGVIFYELLTGWMPFSGNLATLLGSVVSDPPPPPTSLQADLDPRLEAVCLRALEKQPEDRWPSAADFADALSRYQQEDPSGAAGNTAHAEPSGSSAISSPKMGLFGKMLRGVLRPGR